MLPVDEEIVTKYLIISFHLIKKLQPQLLYSMSEKAITLVLKQSDIFYKINICEGYLKRSDYIKKNAFSAFSFHFLMGNILFKLKSYTQPKGSALFAF